MKLKNNWLIWIPLILLLIFIFPKSCGNNMPSEFVEYTCIGFKVPFLSEIEKSNNPQEWCSGICFSETKKMIEPNKTEEGNDINQGPYKGITDSFVKVIPILFLIFLIIAVLKWITSFKNKQSKGEIKVYKSP
jgi:hypothetical protein